VSEGLLASGIINEDAPHGLRGGGEEVRAIIPGGLIVTPQSQPRLVHQRSGLQGLPGIFARHFLRGKFAQLLINQGQEFIRRVLIALVNALKDDGEFAHTVMITGFHRPKEAKNVWATASSVAWSVAARRSLAVELGLAMNARLRKTTQDIVEQGSDNLGGLGKLWIDVAMHLLLRL
jgi:hypothetical protein